MPALGVCYYPEQWPERMWPEQAAQMRELGIDCARIGEFAWSRIEPQREQFAFDWLDRAIEILSEAGLKVVLCTPTACPPKWLVDECPEILPVDQYGHTRGFGSRRHYCFSSRRYREESLRIVTRLVERYGQHPTICGWQIDNELGHHGTVFSYSDDAVTGFRDWLARRYETIDRLNAAWGNVFWSMDYPGFDSVDPPGATVIEANPAHQLAWRRFCSDQVLGYCQRQATIIRQTVPEDIWITTNLVGHFYDYDHYPLTECIDLATWDSYPLGFIEEQPFREDDRARWRQLGHPDLSAFQHDLYRGVGNGRWGIMEQQPGPVNWAPFNASPIPGAVRLWCWEAVAHGAELTAVFRWQQAPFAQEQMHSGLRRPDGKPAPASAEFAQFGRELAKLATDRSGRATVALVFDYASQWVGEIQPHHRDYRVDRIVFEYYRALRSLGVDIDIVPPGRSLQGYQLIVLPALLVISHPLLEELQRCEAQVVIGPRCFSRTAEFSIPIELPPGPLQKQLPLKVVAVDTLRPNARQAFSWDGREYWVDAWLEQIETQLAPSAATKSGQGVLFEDGRFSYLAALTNQEFLRDYLECQCRHASIATWRLPEGLRLRRRGRHCFAMNYGDQPIQLPTEQPLLLGQTPLGRGEVAVWEH